MTIKKTLKILNLPLEGLLFNLLPSSCLDSPLLPIKSEQGQDQEKSKEEELWA